MNTINGIPINWDNDQDNTLFGSLFPSNMNAPNSQNTTSFESLKTNKSFEEISNEIALESPFGKDSLFYTELKGDFFEGYVEMLPILYRIGAAMPEKTILNKEGVMLEEVIISKEKNFEKIFDYKEYSTLNREFQNCWNYWDNDFAGQAILNKKTGYIDREKLFFDKDGAGFNLYLPYKNDSKVSINNANIDYLKANAAIKITQLDTDAFLIILNNLSTSKRKLYVINIFKKIVSEIEAIFKNKQAIDFLYAIPIDLLRLFKKQTLNTIFYQLIGSSNISYYREAILVDILKVLPEKEGFDATSFLNSLLNPIENGESYFDKLYALMNDWGGENNFSKLIIELTKIWSFSVYYNPFLKLYDKYDSPAPIAYSQNYILGFRNDNYDFEMESTTLKLMYNDMSVPIPGTVRYQTHHVFQPIEVVNLNETEAENLKLSEGVKIPAFYLKAFDDKSAWENFEKAVWLAFDVVSTYSGIGNLAKLRYLVRTEKIAYVVIKTTFGVIQVATGTISIGLALIENNKNKDWVNKIREYLFWVEICTLGADILSSRILSKKAKDASEALAEYRKTVKNQKQLDEIDEFSEHLDNVLGDGLYRGKILSKTDIEDWAKMIFKKFGTKLEQVDDFGDPSILAQFDAVTNTIKHKKDVTKYLLFHETMHAEECFTLGKLKYLEDAHIVNTPITDANLLRTYKREKYVYDKIKLHAKEHGFNFDEIDHAELYIEWIELKLKTRGISIPK